jgi:hypothetical protein
MAITTAVWLAVTLAFVIAVTAMLLRSRRPLLRLLQLEAEATWDKMHTAKAEHEKSMEMVPCWLFANACL